MTNPLNLYIHIPFCKAKCNYCHFFTFANKENEIPEYFGSLGEEIVFVADSAKEYEVQTIYIGGGTPSLVDGEVIKNMLSLIHKHYNVSTKAEITIEANPESISKEKAEAWITNGINRVSIGVQAWQDRLLKQVNRLYTIEEFKFKLQTIKQAGLNTINLDLIFGLPGQTFDDWKESIVGVINSDVEHISCYSLELDNNSRWGKLYKLGKFDETSDELNRKMYWYAVKEFAQNGFEQYEISNFSKPGLHSNHNLNFWMGQEYIGLGAGAHSYFGQKRYHNIRNLHKYTISPTESSVIDEISEVNNQVFEFILLRLRLINIGIDINEFVEKFGKLNTEKFLKKANQLKVDGLLEVTETKVILTKKGIDLVNKVMESFLDL